MLLLSAAQRKALLYKNQHVCLFEQRITSEMPRRGGTHENNTTFCFTVTLLWKLSVVTYASSFG